MKKYIRQNSQGSNGRSYGHNRRGFNKPYGRNIGPPSYLSSYEKSVWLMNSFKGRTVSLRDGESSDSLMRRFKKVVEQSGVMRELKRREFHLSKSQKKKEKHKRALKRMRKFEKKMYEFEDENTKPVISADFFSGYFED